VIGCFFRGSCLSDEGGKSWFASGQVAILKPVTLVPRELSVSKTFLLFVPVELVVVSADLGVCVCSFEGVCVCVWGVCVWEGRSHGCMSARESRSYLGAPIGAWRYDLSRAYILRSRLAKHKAKIFLGEYMAQNFDYGQFFIFLWTNLHFSTVKLESVSLWQVKEKNADVSLNFSFLVY